MTERQLDEAMRYGSSRNYGDGRSRTLRSRTEDRVAVAVPPAHGRDQIDRPRPDPDPPLGSRPRRRTDSWQLERLTSEDARPSSSIRSSERTGTVVLWEHLDRVLGARRPGGEAAARRLEAAAAEIAEHLAMVFHRFLAGEAPGPPLAIHVGWGATLTPWDPFARAERLTRALAAADACPLDTRACATRSSSSRIVLPAQHHFSSPEAHEAAGGPNRWNRQQGLYVYRRDRLIQSGGWNRLRTLDEHAKLARIAIDIPPGADPAFRINVSKMTVGLPEGIRPQLRALVAGVVSFAQDVYRRRLAVVFEAGT